MNHPDLHRVPSTLASDAAPGSPSGEILALVLVCVMCGALQHLTRRSPASGDRAGGASDRGAEHAAFSLLRRKYIAVYVLGTFGDWIQGAYLYALYREHGFAMADIGRVFILGYFASATVGTYVSSLGDTHGHRKLVITYGVLYGTACLMMRSSDVGALLLSRVMSGVAYSLLFSSFESLSLIHI